MKILLWLETLMALLLAVVYWIRPDYLAALTIFPAGIWMLFAVTHAQKMFVPQNIYG